MSTLDTLIAMKKYLKGKTVEGMEITPALDEAIEQMRKIQEDEDEE